MPQDSANSFYQSSHPLDELSQILLGQDLRIVSMVPSWTETLLEAGLNVVGRTRFCIHPKMSVKQIPVVGGTKDCNWQALQNLKPNLVIFDCEENPKEIAEKCPSAWYASHVYDLQSLQDNFELLGGLLQNSQLKKWGQKTALISKIPTLKAKQVPGFLGWVDEKSEQAWNQKTYDQIVYVIWRDPWMSAGNGTFISSVLSHLGFTVSKFSTDRYPKFELDQFDLQKTFFLMSSEPYPFHKKQSELKTLGILGAIVDGEGYSWFGVRTLKFLINQSTRKKN